MTGYPIAGILDLALLFWENRIAPTHSRKELGNDISEVCGVLVLFTRLIEPPVKFLRSV